jgi:RNA polymerase sigma-70 factor, ECF subfamily
LAYFGASDDRCAARWTQPVPDETDQMLESQVIVTAMRSLSEDHRRVLLEVYYRRRPVAEAAAILGLPPHTVKLLTYDALRTLKAVLDNPPSTPPR